MNRIKDHSAYMRVNAFSFHQWTYLTQDVSSEIKTNINPKKLAFNRFPEKCWRCFHEKLLQRWSISLMSRLYWSMSLNSHRVANSFKNLLFKRLKPIIKVIIIIVELDIDNQAIRKKKFFVDAMIMSVQSRS